MTQIFFVLPVPWGRTTVPRTIWSEYLGLTPSRMSMSTDSSNLAKWAFLRRLTASSRVYDLISSPLTSRALTVFLPCLLTDDLQSHVAGRALDDLLGRFDVVGVEVGELHPGDLLDLLHGDLADLLLVRRPGPLGDPGRLLQKVGGRRGLDDEVERLDLEHGDEHGDDRALVHLLRPLVELADEAHDVDAVLAQRRPDGRGGAGLCGDNLQLDLGNDFFRHLVLLKLLDLQELELDGGRPAEDGDQDLERAPLGVDLFDDPVEVEERPVDDADRLALLERVLGLGFLRGRLHVLDDLADLLLAEGGRGPAGADEARDLRDLPDHQPVLVVHLHLDEDVAGVRPLRGNDLLAAPDLDDVLGRDDDLPDLVFEVQLDRLLLDRLGDELLEARIGVNDKPVLCHRPIPCA